MPTDTDVLVIGAGPTGLMLATQLARRGVRVRIVDRMPGPARETRALAVQARTLEIYAQLGIVERALELGKRATGANVWSRGRRAARIPLGDIGRESSPYPFVLILGQDDNERILGEELWQYGVEVQRNADLVALEQEAEQVKARLEHFDGTFSEVTAAWVAGCDGAHSAVRESCGIAFDGAPYAHVFFVADVQVTGSMVPGELNGYLRSEAFHVFFPMRGTDHWRLVGILPTQLQGRENLTFDEVIPTVRQEIGHDLVFQSCSWFSTYHIHHRCAERFRDRRCFLLGDAAHIHSPVGGQGMNTGLQDAYNLAWKLALVISGRARPTLLDSYADERIPVATRLLNTTDRAFLLLVSDSRLAKVLRSRALAKLLAFAMRFDGFKKFAFLTVSQTGIRYRESPLSQASDKLPEKAPHPGDRFPWLKLVFESKEAAEDVFRRMEDMRFNLIVIGQDAPVDVARELGDLVRVHKVSSDPANDRELARVHIPRPSFYLLRPDGHVGLAGTRLEASVMKRYVADRLQLGSERA